MTPWVRRLALTAHVSSSVGWVGAVASFLALGLVGLSSQRTEMVRASCIAMELTARFVIVPLSLASLLTGIVQSLGTPWGLVRHHWVLAKLFITTVCTAILLVHMGPIAYLSGRAEQATFAVADLRELRTQLVAQAAAALFALLVAIALSVYKPGGTTGFGWRKRHAASQPSPETDVSAHSVREGTRSNEG
jgi:hypothetical protein